MRSIWCINHLFKTEIDNLKVLRLRRVSQQCVQPVPTKVKRRNTHSKELNTYLSSTNQLKKIKYLIPERFFRKNRKAPDDLYLIDATVATDIAASLEPYILKGNKTIIETNPGFGLLSRKLLEYGVPRMQLHESITSFRDHIIHLDHDYPGRVQIYNRDFFSIWKLSYQDRYDNGDRVKRLLSGIEVRDWSMEPTLALIGAIANTNFMRHLIISLIFQFGVMTYGRCELYLLMPPQIYIQLTAGPATGLVLYRASSVLFQIFCDHQVLMKVPRKAFLPWDNTREFKPKAFLNKFNHIDPESMYLTRIVFKKDLPVSADRFQHIWYFVRHMMISRKTRIIPTLEKWIPGCGTRLILANSLENSHKNKHIFPEMDIFTQIGQMTPDQILSLYKEFSSWPEYSESAFIASLDSALLKMASLNDMDTTNDIEASDIWVSERNQEINEDIQNTNAER